MLNEDQIAFYKMQGTGNNFILIQYEQQTDSELELLAKNMCDNCFGIGADGVLISYPPKKSTNKSQKITNQQYYHMKIINKDGSYAEMCGNGLRCFSALLLYKKLTDKQFKVNTDGGLKTIKVAQSNSNNQYQVSISMGLLTNNTSKDITQDVIKYLPNLQNNLLYAYYVMFNVPHVVLNLTPSYSKQLKQKQIKDIGKFLQERINANINFTYFLTTDNGNQKEIYVETFERGAGLTLSCGTGVCSVYLIALHARAIFENAQTSNINKCITVHTKGGKLEMTLNENEEIVMTGPAKIICSGNYYKK